MLIPLCLRSLQTLERRERVKHHVIGSHTVRTRGERRAHGKEEAPRAIRTAAVWICCYHKRAAAVAYPTKTHYHLCLISHWHEPETVSFQSQSRWDDVSMWRQMDSTTAPG